MQYPYLPPQTVEQFNQSDVVDQNGQSVSSDVSVKEVSQKPTVTTESTILFSQEPAMENQAALASSTPEVQTTHLTEAAGAHLSSDKHSPEPAAITIPQSAEQLPISPEPSSAVPAFSQLSRSLPVNLTDEAVMMPDDQAQEPTALSQVPPATVKQPLPQDIDPLSPVSPPSITPRTDEPAELEPLTPDHQTVPEPSDNIPPDGFLEELGVTDLIFRGNQVFESETLENEITDGEGWSYRLMTLDGLLILADEVANIYRREGYTTSGAVVRIPETTRQLEIGEVIIEVIEGTVETIQIDGNQRLHSDYVRARLHVAEGEALNVERLQESLHLLQIDPLIERVNAELTAGSRVGSSLLAVQIEEAPSFAMPLRLDNSRSPSIGSFQRQLVVSESNLSGVGDRILLGYGNTDGSNVLDFSYQIPINPENGTLGITASQSWNDVIEEPFFDIDGDGEGPDIESQSTQIELTWRQPLSRTIQNSQFQELAIGVTGSYRNSQSFLFGEPFGFSLSSDVDGTTRVSALRLFQDYTLQDAEQVLALRSQLSIGVDAFNSTVLPTIEGVGNIADSQFLAWQGQAQWVRLLGNDMTLFLRGDLQFANQQLLSSEQFSLGGVSTVRGYRQDQLLTDNGVFASAEVRFPVLRVPEWNGTLQLAPFADFGTGWNSGDQPNPETNTLASVGMGLQWQQGDRNQLTARLDIGLPLISAPSRGGTLQEQGIYFSILFNPL